MCNTFNRTKGQDNKRKGNTSFSAVTLLAGYPEV